MNVAAITEPTICQLVLHRAHHGQNTSKRNTLFMELTPACVETL